MVDDHTSVEFLIDFRALDLHPVQRVRLEVATLQGVDDHARYGGALSVDRGGRCRRTVQLAADRDQDGACHSGIRQVGQRATPLGNPCDLLGELGGRCRGIGGRARRGVERPLHQRSPEPTEGRGLLAKLPAIGERVGQRVDVWHRQTRLVELLDTEPCSGPKPRCRRRPAPTAPRHRSTARGPRVLREGRPH